MNRKIPAPALLCAAALLLSGCREKPDSDLSKAYPAQFRYCFGEHASDTLISAEKSSTGTVTDTRLLQFTGADGKERSCQYEILREEPGEVTDRYYFRELLSLTQRAMQIPFMEELSQNILPQHFDDQHSVDSWSLRFGEKGEPNLYGSADGLWADGTELFELSAATDDGRLGISCSAYDAGLRSVAANPFFLLHVRLDAVGAVSAEEAARWRGKLEQLCQDYIAYAGNPQNYIFEFQPANTELSPDAEPLRIAVLLGEPYDGLTDDAVGTLEERLRHRYPGNP